MADDYTQLVTSEHRRDKFLAVVRALTEGFGQIHDACLSLPAAFDLSLAEGVQLDVVGKWVGLGREVTVPIDNNFFSLDTVGKGFDEGYWKDAFVATEGVAFLDDLSYRAALRFQIQRNTWDGHFLAYSRLWVRLEGATPNLVVCHDNQDMTMSVTIYGPPVSSFLRLFIEQQHLIPKPMGVRITSHTFVTAPVFGTDEDSLSISGPDLGFIT